MNTTAWIIIVVNLHFNTVNQVGPEVHFESLSGCEAIQKQLKNPNRPEVKYQCVQVVVPPTLAKQ